MRVRGRYPALLKVKGKKGNNLSEVFFVGAPGMVRVTAVGWLVCACNPCEDGCNRWLECLQGMTWWQWGIACVRVRGGGGNGNSDSNIAADRFG